MAAMMGVLVLCIFSFHTLPSLPSLPLPSPPPLSFSPSSLSPPPPLSSPSPFLLLPSPPSLLFLSFPLPLPLPSVQLNVKDTQDTGFGVKAPVWLPDDSVSMCMICCAEFKLTFRRHHCRACGKVSVWCVCVCVCACVCVCVCVCVHAHV